MAFLCNGSSEPDDHMTSPVTLLNQAPRCLGHSNPYCHDNLVTLPRGEVRKIGSCVCVRVHMWERDLPVLSWTRAVPGTVWTWFKIRLLHVIMNQSVKHT